MSVHIRRTYRLFRIALHFLFGIYIGLGATLSAHPERWSQRWFRGLLKILNLQLQVNGSPEPAGLLVAGNHVSWLDIALLVSVKPVVFVSKAEVEKWPFMGWLARTGDTLFIERGANGTQELNQRLGEMLSAGRAVVIFPEGTTTRGPGVRRFQPRLFAGAIQAQVCVLPFALRYQQASAPYADDDTLQGNLWNILAEPVLRAELNFGPRLTAGQSRDAIAQQTQNWVEETLLTAAYWDQAPLQHR